LAEKEQKITAVQESMRRLTWSENISRKWF
jgi:hypothetical protein